MDFFFIHRPHNIYSKKKNNALLLFCHQWLAGWTHGMAKLCVCACVRYKNCLVSASFGIPLSQQKENESFFFKGFMFVYNLRSFLLVIVCRCVLLFGCKKHHFTK